MLILAACGGGGGGGGGGAASVGDAANTGTTNASGTYQGGDLDFSHAMWINEETALVMLFTTHASCAQSSAGQLEGQSMAEVALSASDPPNTPAPPTSPGVFTVGGGSNLSASIHIIQYDSSCHQLSNDENFASGTVTVTTLDSMTVAGTMSFTAGTDQLTGSFSADLCPGFSSDLGGCGDQVSGDAGQ